MSAREQSNSIQVCESKSEIWFNQNKRSGGVDVVLHDGNATARIELSASAVERLIDSLRAMIKETV